MKFKSKVLITVVLSISIILLSMKVNAATVQTGKFSYMPAFEDKKDEVYYYSDEYFSGSGKKYNEHLCTMSYNLSLSTFEIKGATYVTKLYNDIGFTDIDIKDMNEKPTLNTIGTAIAHKEVGDSNIVAVAIRGEKYDSEWGNNFIVGKQGNAKGLNDTSEKVIDRIKDYISTNNLKNTKIWMVGYSRAGAVADLAGVYINKHLQEFNTTANDLYIYTFEPVAASTDSTVYDNIYTIKNVNDMIPFVYPKSWGFYNNGKTISFGKDKKITTYKGLQEQEKYGEAKLNDFLKETFGWLGDRLDREVYVDKLQEPVSTLLDIYFSKSSEDRTKVFNFLKEDFLQNVIDNKDSLGYAAWGAMGHNGDGVYKYISDKIVALLDEVRNTENGKVLTDSEYQTLRNSIYPVLRGLGPVIVDDNYYYEGIDYDEYYEKNAPDYYKSDYDLGTESGRDSGKDVGYDAGFNGEPKNPDGTDYIDETYGQEYADAYRNAFETSYLEAYDVGEYYKTHLKEKARIDGEKDGIEPGFYDGKNGNEKNTFNDYLYHQDWMTEEYLEEYNKAYAESYEREYEKGKNDTSIDEVEEIHEAIVFYHFATLMKNINNIIENHYPQTNLTLIQNEDSYYNSYKITDGKDQTIKIESNEGKDLVVKCNGDMEKFVKLQVDNNDVDSKYYTIKNGSTIVTLKEDYLETLSNGTHTLKLVYIDGEVETNFKISKISENKEETSDNTQENKKSNTEKKTKKDTSKKNQQKNNENTNPKTGDDIEIWIGLMTVSVLGIIGTIVFLKRNKKME